MLANFQPYNSPLAEGVILPQIKIEPRFYKELGIDSGSSNYEFLRRLCWKGIQERGIDKLPNAKDYYDRIKSELEVFQTLGFIDYVLLNWEVHEFCKEEKIITGWGRGSAAGSLVFYCLNVTKVDPLKYNLYFERFLSAARASKKVVDGVTYLDGSSLCDVDSDISFLDRQRVIEFIDKKHPERTSKILTLATLTSRICIGECLKVVDGLSEKEDVKEITDHIPIKFNVPVPIREALEESEALSRFSKLKQRAFKVALKLEGLVRHTGIHASGIAVTKEKIGEVMPLQFTKDKETGEYGITTGFEMLDVAELAVKLDTLGLKTLSLVGETCKLANISIEDIPENDEETYRTFQNFLAPKGIFQLDSDFAFRICQKVKPRNLDHLATVNALARPGACAFADDFAKFVETGKGASPHPFFDDILKRTGYVAAFQEQLMAMIVKIGFSAKDANAVRKCVGKKLVEDMKEWKKKIYDKVKENNLDEQIADIVWKIAEDSANYSFCAGHSFPYSFLSYVTTYLKTHHTKEFYCALLRMSKYKTKPQEFIGQVAREMPLVGLSLLPPDLAKSQADFSIHENGIRFGMESIKGISKKSIDSLMGFCDTHFDNKYEVFCGSENSKLSIAVLCGLIQAGCLDSFGGERCRMVLEAQVFHQLTQREKLAVMECGESHNYDIFAALRLAANGEIVNDKGKPVFTEKRLEKLRGEHAKFKAIYDQNIKHKEFCYWYFEHNLLGYSYSYNLRQVFDEPEHTYTPFLELQSHEDGETLRLVGVVTDCVKAKSKKNGEKYLRIHLADEGGNATCLFMNTSKFRKLDEYLEKGNAEPKKDQIVTVVGKKNGDIFFVDKIAILDEVIALKLRDLKK